MKKIIYLVIILISVSSCGSNKNFQSFFNQHKSDLGVTAFQMPNFMKTILANIAPKQNMFDDLADFKFITFNKTTPIYQKKLISEMNVVANNKFTDMFRKNTIENTKIISVKELGNIVTEAIIFDSKHKKTTVFYIKGRFDPEKIRAFSDDATFDNFSTKLLQEYQVNINLSLNPSFNPNE